MSLSTALVANWTPAWRADEHRSDDRAQVRIGFALTGALLEWAGLGGSRNSAISWHSQRCLVLRVELFAIYNLPGWVIWDIGQYQQ